MRPSFLSQVFGVVNADVPHHRYPGIVRFGGNTGTVNSFAGVDVTNLTGGVYNLADLAQGNNGACFFMQLATQGLPDATDTIVGLGKSVLEWATEQIAPLNSKLNCPQLADFNGAIFDQFPGANYKADEQQTSFLGDVLG